jgi:hypothetical protein
MQQRSNRIYWEELDKTNRFVNKQNRNLNFASNIEKRSVNYYPNIYIEQPVN